MKSGQHSYIGTLQALFKRCDIDHASGCWLWLGATNGAGAASVYTWDYERGEKRSMTGSRAAWGLMHKRAVLPGFVAYRVCIRRRCVWPSSKTSNRPKAIVIRRESSRRGKRW